VTEGSIEKRIREMRDSGELSGLPGEGAPLPHDPDADAGDAWAARHLARTSRARPEWVTLRQEIETVRSRIAARVRAHLAWLERRHAQLRGLPAERILREVEATRVADERVRGALGAAVDELNALIRKHNLVVSSAALHFHPVTLETLLARERDGATTS
jgi:DnaJ-like protein